MYRVFLYLEECIAKIVVIRFSLIKECVSTACSVVDDLGSYSKIFVLSNSPDGSNSCVKEVQRAVYQTDDRFYLSGFVNPPYNDLKCVCSFNGIDVMNRKDIPDQACLTLPD